MCRKMGLTSGELIPHAFQACFDLPHADQDCFAVDQPVKVPVSTLLAQLV